MILQKCKTNKRNGRRETRDERRETRDERRETSLYVSNFYKKKREKQIAISRLSSLVSIIYSACNQAFFANKVSLSSS